MKECGKASGRTILMSNIGVLINGSVASKKKIQVKGIIKPAGVDAADKILG